MLKYSFVSDKEELINLFLLIFDETCHTNSIESVANLSSGQMYCDVFV
jgi:hypothetical protein